MLSAFAIEDEHLRPGERDRQRSKKQTGDRQHRPAEKRPQKVPAVHIAHSR